MEPKCANGEAGVFGNEAYVRTLQHIGKPVWLPNAQCWVLEREIPNQNGKDLIGVYPMISPISQQALLSDIGDLSESYVSFVAVTNPMSSTSWSPCLSELVAITQYKPHFVTNLDNDPAQWLTPTAKRNIGYSRKQFSFQEVNAEHHWKKLADLYPELKRRVKDLGLAEYTRDAIERQCFLNGARLFTIEKDGACHGATLVFVSESTAYFHLAAYSDDGYANRGGYSLIAGALDALRDSGVRYAHLGGAPDGPNGNGIAEFKGRFSSETRMSHIVKVVLQPYEYARLSGGIFTGYFPYYRKSKSVAA